MIRREVALPDKEILQRRTAAQLVQVASRFDARIMIEHQSKVINAKSMLGLLSLGAVTDGRLYLVADGEDEQRAVDAIAKLLDSNFAE
jgi:phosphotransferase system HPr (HPr) family protein